METTTAHTNEDLLLLESIMEGNIEWFVKDGTPRAALSYSTTNQGYETITVKYSPPGSTRIIKLNFTDIDEALVWLAANGLHRDNEPGEEELSKNTGAVDPAAPFAEFMGMKLHSYDSWTGSSCNITIEEAVQGTASVHFTGSNRYGGKSGIFVDNDLVEDLLKYGYAERIQEIDHCNVITRWNLN